MRHFPYSLHIFHSNTKLYRTSQNRNKGTCHGYLTLSRSEVTHFRHPTPLNSCSCCCFAFPCIGTMYLFNKFSLKRLLTINSIITTYLHFFQRPYTISSSSLHLLISLHLSSVSFTMVSE